MNPSVKIPWKAITLAALLFVGGTIMLIMGSLIVSGHIDSKVKYLNNIFIFYIFKIIVFHYNLKKIPFLIILKYMYVLFYIHIYFTYIILIIPI